MTGAIAWVWSPALWIVLILIARWMGRPHWALVGPTATAVLLVWIYPFLLIALSGYVHYELWLEQAFDLFAIFLVLGWVLALAAVLTAWLRPKPAVEGPICDQCGYNLTGCASSACSECGATHNLSPVETSAHVRLRRNSRYG